MNDFKSVKTSEIIAWGGFKGKFRRQYTKVAGIETIDGHKVFKSLDITNGMGDKKNEVYKFLKIYGFSKEDIEDMDDKRHDSKYKVKTMNLEYKIGVSYSEESFEKALQKIFGYGKGGVVLGVKNILVDESLSDADAAKLAVGIKQLGMNWNIERGQDDDGEALEKPRSGNRPNLKVLLDSIDFISGGIPVPAMEALSIIAAIEPGVVAVKMGAPVVTKVSFGGKKYKQVFQKEKIMFPAGVMHSMIQRYKQFVDEYRDHNSCKDKTDEECDMPVEKSNWTNIIWRSFAELNAENLFKETNGLFYRPPPKEILNKKLFGKKRTDSKVYMTVKGVKKARPDDFGFYVSMYLHINVKRKKGGFIARFFGGIIRAFLSILDALIGIFLKIPILKQVTLMILNFIGNIFGVDIDTARGILAQILMTVILFFVMPVAIDSLKGLMGIEAATTSSALLPGMSASMSSSLTMFSQGMSMYNNASAMAIASMEQDRIIEDANAEYAAREEEVLDPIQGAFGGTMGSMETHEQADKMNYDVIFNPFYYWEQAIPSVEFGKNGKK